MTGAQKQRDSGSYSHKPLRGTESPNKYGDPEDKMPFWVMLWDYDRADYGLVFLLPGS